MGGPLLAGFETSLVDRGDETAIFALSEARRITFRQLADQAAAVNAALDRAHVPPGTCILELAGNRASWFALFLACLERGNTLISMRAEAPAGEVESLAAHYNVSAIVTDARRSDVDWMATEELPPGLRVHVRDAVSPVSFDDTAVLKLTSGSTGQPRAVPVSEEMLWNDGRHIIEAMDIRASDVNYGIVPMSHSYGLGNLVAPLFIQGTALALRELFLPAQLAEDAHATGLTVIPGVPFLYEQILSQLRGARLPSSVRLLITAGARIDPELVVEFHDELDAKIHSFYGSSETGGITYDGTDAVETPLSVGLAMPETDVSLGADERVYVRGNALARGYVESTGDETAAFVDGGFLTGDTGAFDTDGRLFLTGRLSSFVNVAGRKVNPSETENVLLAMAEIGDAKVLGVPCDKRGEKLVAFIVPRTSALSAVQIRSYCAERLSPHKIPRDLFLLDELPRTERGKIDRRQLEAMLP